MTSERWNTPKREWNNCAFACRSEVTCSTHPPICGLWQKTQVLFTLFVPLQTSSDHYLNVRQDVCFEGWRGNGDGVGCRSEELGAALPAAECVGRKWPVFEVSCWGPCLLYANAPLAGLRIRAGIWIMGHNYVNLNPWRTLCSLNNISEAAQKLSSSLELKKKMHSLNPDWDIYYFHFANENLSDAKYQHGLHKNQCFRQKPILFCSLSTNKQIDLGLKYSPVNCSVYLLNTKWHSDFEVYSVFFFNYYWNLLQLNITW